ncbi:MAG: ABC-type sugar transport system, periplasmic component [Glaciihabitans sp.]|nr:ABC-type sugar transport system, periplasmic component [Glaciihabitans sp.]
MKNHRILTTVAALGASALVLTGCSAGVSGAGYDGKVTIDFWSWAPNTHQLVDVWNE